MYYHSPKKQKQSVSYDYGITNWGKLVLQIGQVLQIRTIITNLGITTITVE